MDETLESVGYDVVELQKRRQSFGMKWMAFW